MTRFDFVNTDPGQGESGLAGWLILEGDWERQDLRRMQTAFSAFLNLRRRSLIRGNALVFVSLLVAVVLSDFPHNRATLLLLLPAFSAVAGTAETVRCLQRRWSFYHAGVMLCVYMDLMAVSIITFLLVYPYWRFLSASS